jgi:hypothetical protein
MVGRPTEETQMDDQARANAGTPRWVKVFGTVAAVVFLLFVVMLIGGHRPGRHLHGGPGSDRLPSNAQEHEVQQIRP